MRRSILAVLFSLTSLATLPAQEISREQFRADFSKSLEIADDKGMDKVMKRGPVHAALYYEELYWEKDAGKAEAAAKCLALQASWQRSFDGSDTLAQLDRWCSGATNQMREQLQKGRTSSFKVWNDFNEHVSQKLVRDDFVASMQSMMTLARNAEAFGHQIEISELWSLTSVIAAKTPDKTIADRRDAVFATEQFLAARKSWNFTFDEHYIRSTEWVKNEKAKIEAAEKDNDKRSAEGYDANAKGVEALVVPNAVEAKHALKFEALANWDELDYGPKGGPVPAFWWMASTTTAGSSAELGWFTAAKLYLLRTAATKFAIALGDPTATKDAVEIDASSKGKVSTFWLDQERKRPYAMVFWTGSDREMVNEAECNLAPGDNVGNVYYRSASSWKGLIGADPIVLYDDSADGTPGDAMPWDDGFHLPTLGAHDVEKGTPAPRFDSMRIGKGPRQPFSEFVKLSTGWMHLKKGPGDDVAVRPLNPEYVKPGKIKLVWTGPKPSAPVQIVVQGQADYQTALFDVAGGKEIEVPAADYKVIWGRVMNGKGARAQIASIHAGTNTTFTVEPGKTFELKMGAPFTLTWTRRGDENASIDALKILLQESSGCVFTHLHGVHLANDVMAAKSDDGKGAKAVGKFVRFTDPELVNKASIAHNNMMQLVACFPMPDDYREGPLVLPVVLPAAGMKLALVVKKHPLFGDVKPVWQ